MSDARHRAGVPRRTLEVARLYEYRLRLKRAGRVLEARAVANCIALLRDLERSREDAGR